MAQGNRPVLKLPLSKLEKTLEIIAMLCMLSSIYLAYYFWTYAPERVPTHFGPTGNPDNWGGKASLMFLPIVTVFLYLLLTIIGRFPHVYNYMVEITDENAEFQYRNARTMMAWLKLDIIILFGYIEWIIVRVASGKALGLGIWFLPVFLAVLFGSVGFYTYRMVKYK